MPNPCTPQPAHQQKQPDSGNGPDRLALAGRNGGCRPPAVGKLPAKAIRRLALALGHTLSLAILVNLGPWAATGAAAVPTTNGAAAGQGKPTATVAWRCGPGDFRQTPCPGGQPLNLNNHTPSRTQQQAAQTRTRDLQRLADDMRAARHATERAALGRGATGIGPSEAAGHSDRRATQAHARPGPRPVKRTPGPRAPERRSAKTAPPR